MEIWRVTDGPGLLEELSKIPGWKKTNEGDMQQFFETEHAGIRRTGSIFTDEDSVRVYIDSQCIYEGNDPYEKPLSSYMDYTEPC